MLFEVAEERLACRQADHVDEQGKPEVLDEAHRGAQVRGNIADEQAHEERARGSELELSKGDESKDAAEGDDEEESHQRG